MKFSMTHTINQMRLKRLRKILHQVNSYSDAYAQLEDAALQAKTAEFQKAIQVGTSLSQLLPEAYAVIREASRRVLGMYPKDVQVLGAIVLHEGNIAEMQTGEGKTLTATMPLYLNALTGKGAYLITTNDYLARRDYEEMKPLFEWLGLTIALGFVDIPDYEYMPGEKQKIYSHDIIYTTNGRLGFDYLIDNLADGQEGKFLPDLNFGIIDEADSIILDSAQTPLVISGAPRVQSNLFHIVKAFVETLKKDVHFNMEKTKKEIWLTPEGIDAANAYFGIESIYEEGYFDLARNINLALRARHLFDANLDYFVYNGEVVLIDRITGRMLPGTKLQSGLHQAIEAKENVELSLDMSVMATITFQNLFRQFNDFSGMSATSKLGEKEFFDLYSKVVVQIPTDRPIARHDEEDRVFKNAEDKNKAILERVQALYESQRPVLLITRTAEVAEYFSMALFELNIPNNLLIAQNVAKEAQMIAEAGQLSAVTVATSMAGRGTDIKLAEGVQELGGLAVIISEHMENSRVDRQLRGRAGRQGDPGSSQIYISLEDYLVKRWGKGHMLNNDKLNQVDSDTLQQSRMFQKRVQKTVARAQRVSEEHGVLQREMANEYEKSISIQRELIYQERDRVLALWDMGRLNLAQLAEEVFRRDYRQKALNSREKLIDYIYQRVSFQFANDLSDLSLHNEKEVVTFLTKLFESTLQAQEQALNDNYFYTRFVQKAILKAIDSHWIQQVDHLQQLKSSVQNRQNGQRNAIFEYHKVALESFETMSTEIKGHIIHNLCQSVTTFDKEGKLVVHFPN
ncbi:accessory Sec system translocase SecA2 [Staphylococcus chromogenes]|uniref:accessory Sec system translocase SecA2 n=1 Tax=Staphylococcus chromogenes TaxID=46126 RepID=UPI000D03B5E9|nr:accessory Sec system translocase SecA2 [Staphylococcus chromogenes]MDT0698687.1 accessory Sec system translocase SecA2 [Staphylococcus chromogenes]PTG22591.1 accessory Sec system translocase SecA2 [Staphylococcus chromogenes]PTG95350.1 accessory Sec system translocase SecA2 [Staphylococcus chromogenes]